MHQEPARAWNTNRSPLVSRTGLPLVASCSLFPGSFHLAAAVPFPLEFRVIVVPLIPCKNSKSKLEFGSNILHSRRGLPDKKLVTSNQSYRWKVTHLRLLPQVTPAVWNFSDVEPSILENDDLNRDRILQRHWSVHLGRFLRSDSLRFDSRS